MTSRTCHTCRFFQEAGDAPTGLAGICRLNPPATMGHPIQQRNPVTGQAGIQPIFIVCWPQVKFDDWCSHHATKLEITP